MHAARTATPPAPTAIHGGDANNPDDQPAGRKTSSTSSSSLLRSEDEEAEDNVAGKSVEAWRRKLLREMLRSELGFYTVVRESGIPGAGLGLFVEGSAPEGAVVAIYPVSLQR